MKKEKKKAKKKPAVKRLSTALARTSQESRALSKTERGEVASALDGLLGERGRRLRSQASMVRAMRDAATLLAPYFNVSAPFQDLGVKAEIPDSDTFVEVLCSAGAWIAYARGMSKDELTEKFSEWMREQGYE